jgi:predicted  nucleic acid-binding Zn-ribbon protein
MLASQEAQITQLQNELSKGADEAKASQAEVKELRTERDRLTERLEAVSFARDNMMAQISAADEELTEVRVLAASHEREARLHSDRTKRLSR